MRQAAPFLSAAWTLTAALLAGALGGRWLDGRLDTGPWLTLLGIGLGLGVGFYELARVALRPPGASGDADGGPANGDDAGGSADDGSAGGAGGARGER